MKQWGAVGVCECGVGDKAFSGEEHSQITTLIQQGQTIYRTKVYECPSDRVRMLIVLETHCYVCMVTNRVDFELSSHVAEIGKDGNCSL